MKLTEIIDGIEMAIVDLKDFDLLKTYDLVSCSDGPLSKVPTSWEELSSLLVEADVGIYLSH